MSVRGVAEPNQSASIRFPEGFGGSPATIRPVLSAINQIWPPSKSGSAASDLAQRLAPGSPAAIARALDRAAGQVRPRAARGRGSPPPALARARRLRCADDPRAEAKEDNDRRDRRRISRRDLRRPGRRRATAASFAARFAARPRSPRTRVSGCRARTRHQVPQFSSRQYRGTRHSAPNHLDKNRCGNLCPDLNEKLTKLFSF